VSLDLVVLAILMGAVTYPSRALPLLVPGIDRLPGPILAYLRLVGPAVLAALVAANVLVVSKPGGGPGLHVGIESVGVLVAIGIVVWRRNLLLGIAAAAFIVAVARATGLA
jgi:branched-subunit amino acid transport protein